MIDYIFDHFAKYFDHLAKINGFLVTIGGAGLYAVLSNGFKNIRKTYKKTRANMNALKEADLALLHYRIYKCCQQCLDRGYATLEDLDNLEYFWEAYRNLGGNGTGEKLYRDVKKLPVKKIGNFDKEIEKNRGDE